LNEKCEKKPRVIVFRQQTVRAASSTADARQDYIIFSDDEVSFAPSTDAIPDRADVM
jgi:hypothetical protein